jgi:hypothetical protein
LPTKFVRFFWWQVGLLASFFKLANKAGKLANLPTKLASYFVFCHFLKLAYKVG